MRLFGSSGIRGIVNKRIDCDLVMKIGSALGQRYGRVVVGRDPRPSGQMVLDALTAGLLSCGSDASDAGIVATPTLARATARFDAGVMITASHNPPEYNGLKLWNPDGTSFVLEQMEETEASILGGTFNRAGWRDVGSLSDHPNAVEEHIESVLRTVKPTELDVVVDCGCGAASHTTPYLLSRMGCRVRTLNCQLDGTFPGRPSEPTEENLALLIKTVRETGADLGIAHDGDADRMVAVDDRGRYVAGDELLAIFGKCTARTRMVVPVNASMAVEDYVGVEVVRTMVGDVYISEELKRNGGEFGGEPSGTWVFPQETYCPDGILAAARLVELAGEQRLSGLADSVPKYPLMRGAVEFEAASREAVIERLSQGTASLDASSISDLDGWRAEFDGGWGLIRLSGTEPKIRITAEARDEQECRKIFNKMKSLAELSVG